MLWYMTSRTLSRATVNYERPVNRSFLHMIVPLSGATYLDLSSSSVLINWLRDHYKILSELIREWPQQAWVP